MVLASQLNESINSTCKEKFSTSDYQPDREVLNNCREVNILFIIKGIPFHAPGNN